MPASLEIRPSLLSLTKPLANKDKQHAKHMWHATRMPARPCVGQHLAAALVGSCQDLIGLLILKRCEPVESGSYTQE